MGEGWESASPDNMKGSSIMKPRTFASLVVKHREAGWLERPPGGTGGSGKTSIGEEGRAGSNERKTGMERNATPVRVRIKRLEAIGKAGVSTTGRKKDFQCKILQFLNSKGGGEDTSKALASQEVRQSSLLKDRCPVRASLGAQRLAVARSRLKTSSVVATPHREGREKVGKGTGENKGLGPLGKWLKPLEDIRRGQSKVEDEGGGGEVSVGLGPGVRTLRSRFEERRAECPEDPGVERDPAKPGSGER